MNVGDFIYKSEPLTMVKGYYVNPEDFLKAYSNMDMIERKSLVCHYIMDNSPFAFTEIYKTPLVFDQVRQYISHILDVDVNNIKLIGSTKTGFRMDSENYGIPYSKGRDLDFMIIDKVLFSKLSQEFFKWKKAYMEDGIMKPHNEKAKGYWDEHMVSLPRTIDMGFVDTNKMPSRNDILPITSRVNNTMSMIVRNLKSEYEFDTSKASMRVYKDVDSYFCQQNRNIEYIMKVKGY